MILSAFERAYTPGSKTAVFYHENIYRYVISQKLNRTDPPKLLSERYMLEAKALLFPNNHFLFNTFDRKLQQYVEADLINYNNRKWRRANNPRMFEKQKEPFAVLTLRDLEASFVVCLLPFCLSIFVFALEWLRTLIDLIVFLDILKKYYKIKEFAF